ncbi:MAG: tetratricopeptide repeat protein, partial [Spirochaetota bacterium]
LIGLGNLFYIQENYEDAIIYYKKVLQYIEGNPYLYNNVGVAYLKIGSIDTAENYLKKTLEFSKKNSTLFDVYANLANVYIEKKEFDKAIESLEKYKEANNNSAQSLERLAKAYIYSQNYIKALNLYSQIMEKIYEKALQSKENSGQEIENLIEDRLEVNITDIVNSIHITVDNLMSNMKSSKSANSDYSNSEITKLIINIAEKIYKLNNKESSPKLRDYSLNLLKKAEAISREDDEELTAETELLIGKISFEMGEKEKALPYLEKHIFNIKPAEKNIYKMLAEYYFSRNEMNKAINIIQLLEELYPESTITALLYGMAYSISNEYKKAEQKLVKAINNEPFNPLPKIELGKLYLKTKEYDKAIDVFKLVIEIQNNAEAYLYLAKAYRRINKLQLAIQTYKKVLGLNLNSKDKEIKDKEIIDEARQELAHLYNIMGEHQKTINLLESVTEKLSNKEYKLLAVSYIEQKQYENALKTLRLLSPEEEKVKDLTKEELRELLELYYLKGFTEYKLNNKDKAILNLNKALSINNKYSKALRILGDLYYEDSNYKQAFSYYKKVIDKSADEDTNTTENNNNGLVDSDAKLCKRIAVSAFENKDYESAEKYLNKALKLVRVDHELYYYLGLSQINNNNFEEAVENLLTATELKTNFIDAYLELGKLFTIMKSYSEAIAIFNKAAEFPEFRQISNTKNQYKKDKYLQNKEYWAEALISLEEYDEAIQIFDSILNIAPARVSALTKYAQLLSQQGRKEEAISKYKNIINIDPDNYQACLNLAEEFFNTKNYIQASHYYSMCVRINENNDFTSSNKALYKYALSLYKLSNYNEALTPLKKILINSSGNLNIEENTYETKEALLLSGKIYLAQMRVGEAISSFEKYKSLIDEEADKSSENNIEIIFLLGLSHYLGRNYEKAIDLLKKLVGINTVSDYDDDMQIDPFSYESDIANYLIGMSYYCLNDRETALNF